MVDETSTTQDEARAVRRLRTVGYFVTGIWLSGLLVYFVGLASTDSGFVWPSLDLRAWRENVSFLLDWTSLIVISGSFSALLWWPKKVVDTVVGLLSKHRIRFESFLRSLLRFTTSTRASSATSDRQFAPTSGASPRESDTQTSGADSPNEHLKADESTPSPNNSETSRVADRPAAPPQPSRSQVGWGVVVAVVLLGLLLAWCNGERKPTETADLPPSPVVGTTEPTVAVDRSYVMREGDARGAVHAITRTIGDPVVREQCIKALERDPKNRPPYDRRQLPGYAVPLPAECPMP